MTKRAKTAKSTGGSRQQIRFERTYQGPIEDVWDLWTTKEGIESWWGPEGFATAVRKLDLRPGGGFEYAMTATDPAQIEGLKALGVALTSVARGTYTEVVPPHRLAYKTIVDFIPGAEPYEVAAVVEFQPLGQGVRMVVTEDAMHNEQWTQLSTMGMKSSLDKLVKVLESRRVHR